MKKLIFLLVIVLCHSIFVEAQTPIDNNYFGADYEYGSQL